MTNLLLIPILGPFGSNQLTVASGAAYPERGTTIGYHGRHGNLPAVASPDEPTVP
jgi:hypothetical protein